MNNLQISQSFSVEDIRRIRNDDDKRRRDMTPKELADDIRKGAEEGHRIMAEIRKRNANEIGRAL